MPKMKTQKNAAKRFKVSKSGKIMRGTQNGRHLRNNKSKAQPRRLKEPKRLSHKFEVMVKNMLAS